MSQEMTKAGGSRGLTTAGGGVTVDEIMRLPIPDEAKARLVEKAIETQMALDTERAQARDAVGILQDMGSAQASAMREVGRQIEEQATSAEKRGETYEGYVRIRVGSGGEHETESSFHSGKKQSVVSRLLDR